MPYLKYKRRVRRAPAVKAPLRAAAKAKVMNKKASYASLDTVARQVKRIRTEMRKDIEVKEYTPSPVPDSLLVGQVSANVTGTAGAVLDIASTAQGTGANARIGNKAKLIGIGMRFAVTTQSQTKLGSQLIFEIWKTQDNSLSLASARDVLYDVDSISTVVDYNSSKNQDFIKSRTNPNGQYQLVGRKRIYMKQDDITSASVTFKNFKMFIKQQQQLDYLGSPAQSPSNVRYLMFIRADTGNINSSTASTLLVPETLANSGFLVRYQLTSYYVDN